MRSQVIFTLLFMALSATAHAFSTLKLNCTGEGISLSGTLTKSNDTLSGNINVTGAIHVFAGTYTFLPAGTFYKSDDLEMIKLYSADDSNLYFESKTIGQKFHHKFSADSTIQPLNCTFEKN
jgi:hypothetical protein